jgi:hypothetical protein
MASSRCVVAAIVAWPPSLVVEIEAAFKTMKDDLHLRPIHHQLEHRIEAHIFVAGCADFPLPVLHGRA